MGPGRRPREVYRTLSEEELLDGDAGVDERLRDPAPERSPSSEFAQIGATGNLARRTRAILLTILAACLGLVVGLAAVTLIDGGGLPDVGSSTPASRPSGPVPTAGAGLPGLPIRESARARRQDAPGRARHAWRAAVAAAQPPILHAGSTTAQEASPEPTIGDAEPEPSPAPPAPPVPAAAPVASGLSLVAREAGSEFGFER
jgi:hypothetical protein